MFINCRFRVPISLPEAVIKLVCPPTIFTTSCQDIPCLVPCVSCTIIPRSIFIWYVHNTMYYQHHLCFQAAFHFKFNLRTETVLYLNSLNLITCTRQIMYLVTQAFSEQFALLSHITPTRTIRIKPKWIQQYIYSTSIKLLNSSGWSCGSAIDLAILSFFSLNRLLFQAIVHSWIRSRQ